MDNAGTIIAVIGFVGVLISLVAGFTTVKKNISEMTENLIEHRVAMEHRFTALETNLYWLKEHLPKRKSDI